MLSNNNGEISSQYLVTIILVIAGFVILLMIFFAIDWDSESDRELCHQSVVFRGSLPENFDIKNIPSLQCKTKKICITDNLLRKGECPELGEDYETVRVSGTNAEIEAQIKSILAEETADCWSMMGEGKLQIFSRTFEFGTTNKRCVVCTRIDFEEDVKKKVPTVGGFTKYLEDAEVPGKKISYSEYLLGIKKTPSYDSTIDTFKTTQKAIVFIESSNSEIFDWAGMGVGLVAGGFVVSKVATNVVMKVLLIGNVKNLIVGGATYGGESITQILVNKFRGHENSYWTGFVIKDYDSEGLDKLECDSFENIS